MRKAVHGSKDNPLDPPLLRGNLSTRMRAWMSERKGLFTVLVMSVGIDADVSKTQDAINNFVRRGEVFRAETKKHKRLQYYYNHGWTPKKRGKLNRRIYKAMRLISFEKGFAANDVQRLAGIDNIVTVHKTIKKLLADGYLRCEGVRKKGVRWKEKLYRVVDTDRFHKDLIIESGSQLPVHGSRLEGK